MPSDVSLLGHCCRSHSSFFSSRPKPSSRSDIVDMIPNVGGNMIFFGRYVSASINMFPYVEVRDKEVPSLLGGGIELDPLLKYGG